MSKSNRKINFLMFTNLPKAMTEGTAIVISILLAFAIDAWWDEQRDEAQHRALTSSLLSEFENSHEKLKEQLTTLQQSVIGTSEALTLFGPEATLEQNEVLVKALQKSLSVGSFSYRYISLSKLLSLKGDIDFIPEQTWTLLQSWKNIMNDLDVDSKHLERNREEHFLNMLIRLDVSLLQLSPKTTNFNQVKERTVRSKFKNNLNVILRDSGAESVLAMRALRLEMLIDTYQEAIAISEYIIDSLKKSVSHG